MVENPSSSSGSALEKARLLKEQKLQEQQERQQKSLEQQQKTQEAIDLQYQTTEQQIRELETKKQEIKKQILEVRKTRKQKIDSQRGAIAELTQTEETRELLNDDTTKQEIFGDDQRDLENVKEQEKTLKEQLVQIESEIEQRTAQKNEIFKETKEGKEYQEQLEQKEIQEKIKNLINLEKITKEADFEKAFNIPKLIELIENYNRETVENQLTIFLHTEISESLKKTEGLRSRYTNDRKFFLEKSQKKRTLLEESIDPQVKILFEKIGHIKESGLDFSNDILYKLKSTYESFERNRKVYSNKLNEIRNLKNDLQDRLSETIDVDSNGYIHSPEKKKQYDEIVREIEKTRIEIEKLKDESQTLNQEIQKATFGFGNGKRKERLEEIKKKTEELQKNLEFKNSEGRNIKVGVPIQNILQDLGINPREIITHDATIGSVLTQLEIKQRELTNETIDPRIKQLIDKLEKLKEKSNEIINQYSYQQSERWEEEEVQRYLKNR